MDNQKKEITLLDFVIIIIKNLKVLILVPVIVGIVIFILLQLSKILPSDSSLNFFPSEYTPEARILLKIPSDTGGGVGGLLNGSTAELGSLVGLLGAGVNSNSEMGDFIFILLRSNSLRDKIIDEFNFKEVYHITKHPRENAREIFEKHLIFEIDSTSSSAIIGYTDLDREFATGIVKRVVEELEIKIKEIYLGQTIQKKTFLEERIKEQSMNLNKAQDELITFQVRNEIFDVNVQSQTTMTYIARLQQEVYTKELELKSLKDNYSFNSFDIEVNEKELEQLQNLLDEMKTGFKDYSSEFIPRDKLPEISVEYLYLYQEVQLQGAILKLLRQQYEAVKLEETDNTMILNVLDMAEVPEKKSGPPRTLLFILFVVVAFFLTFFIIMLKEVIQTISQDPEEAEKIQAIKEAGGALFKFKKSK